MLCCIVQVCKATKGAPSQSEFILRTWEEPSKKERERDKHGKKKDNVRGKRNMRRENGTSMVEKEKRSMRKKREKVHMRKRKSEKEEYEE